MRGIIILGLTVMLASAMLAQKPKHPRAKGTFAPTLTARQIARKSFPSVVLLVTEDSSGEPAALGSGFFITEDSIATNLHVVTGASRIYAKMIGRKALYDITGIIADEKRDLAILRIQGVRGQPLPLGRIRELAVGDEVYVLGNPEGLEGTFSQGIISAIRGSGYIQITAPISHGSSGSPVLNSRGQAIGVAVGIFKDGQNLNFAVPISYLSSLLTRRFQQEGTKPVTPPSAELNDAPSEPVRSCIEIWGNYNWIGSERHSTGISYPTLHTELASGFKLTGTLQYEDREQYKVSGDCSRGILKLEYFDYARNNPFTAIMTGTIDQDGVLTGKTVILFRDSIKFVTEWKFSKKP